MNLETLRIQRESKLKEIGIILRKERERRKLTVNDVFIDPRTYQPSRNLINSKNDE